MEDGTGVHWVWSSGGGRSDALWGLDLRCRFYRLPAVEEEEDCHPHGSRETGTVVGDTDDRMGTIDRTGRGEGGRGEDTRALCARSCVKRDCVILFQRINITAPTHTHTHIGAHLVPGPVGRTTAPLPLSQIRPSCPSAASVPIKLLLPLLLQMMMLMMMLIRQLAQPEVATNNGGSALPDL